jgi:hypothetical protein
MIKLKVKVNGDGPIDWQGKEVDVMATTLIFPDGIIWDFSQSAYPPHLIEDDQQKRNDSSTLCALLGQKPTKITMEFENEKDQPV